jgi:succinate---hydroxymethylglutarate CoA-transferase
MTVNFKTPEGLGIIRKLVKKSDVLVENFVSGKLVTMGLGWEDCRKINERLIYASITGPLFSPYSFLESCFNLLFH